MHGDVIQRRWVVQGLLGLCLFVAALASAAQDSNRLGYLQIHAAEFAMTGTETPPLNHKEWRRVSIPDRWATDNRWEQGRTGWYRIPLPDGRPAEPQAIYIQRLSTNAQVYLNDEFVGSGGSFEEPVARNMHRPLFFYLPGAAWQEQDNYLYLRLITYPGYAHVGGLRVGEIAAMEPTYEWQFFIQVTLSRIFFVIAVLAGVFGLTFWLFIERTAGNLYFGLAACFWSVYCANLFLRDLPISAELWWPMFHVTLEWAGAFFILFTHRVVGVKPRVIEGVLLCFAATATLTYISVDVVDLLPTTRAFHAVLLGFMVYLNGLLLWRIFKYQDPDAMVIEACLIALTFFAWNDLVRHTVPIDDPNWQTPFYLLQFGTPAMFIILSSFLISRVLRGQKLQMASDMDRELARQAERERIYQDLHDDVGAKLLSLFYRAEDGEGRELARSALADIREIVSGNPNESIELPLFMDLQLAEAEERCRGLLKLRWDAPIDPEARVSGEFAYHFSRILRELLTNTLRHAAAREVRVAIAQTDDDLELDYADDGVGLLGPAVPGRGLAGIQRRIQALGGAFDVGAEQPGFSVRVSVPLESAG
ncbi:MAG: 7TM diverse intracellular signaling domain-containing protein [Pseudomonadota bacterium]